MPNPHDSNGMPHIEVDDAAAAMRKTEQFARSVLSVPKKKIDAKLAKEKEKRDKRK